jgi:hypothetical protein
MSACRRVADDAGGVDALADGAASTRVIADGIARAIATTRDATRRDATRTSRTDAKIDRVARASRDLKI